MHIPGIMAIGALAIAMAALPMVPAPAAAAELTLKRVVLSTGGVAYLEHEAKVEGDAELGLEVPLAQVDDVLKSLVVFDGQGGVGQVSLPGREPLAQLFDDLPFGADALASPAALLGALRGAEVRVGSTRPLTGKLLSVTTEDTRAIDGSVTSRTRVSLLTESGIRQFILEEADAVGFVDPTLQARVGAALTAIASYHAKDRRRLTLTLRGTGSRVVRVGYVVGAPLWKATYRMTLPAEGAAKGHVQGWAVLENMTGQDWHDVELTLLSGNPVSFRQAIYEAYYVDRPWVPVEVTGRVLPQPDTGVMAKAAVEQTSAVPAPAPPPAMAAPHFRRAAPGGAAVGGLMAAGAPPPAPPPLAEAANVAEAEEAATQVVFRIPVAVTVASGASAEIPIIDRDLPVQRLALYQSGTHPLASLKVANDGGTGLPPGVLTLYERSADGDGLYVGDARLAAFPAGEERLLSYAVDEKTRVVREPSDTQVIAKGGVAQGVLHITRLARHAVLYRLAAPATEARRVLIEQPRMPGWRLVTPAESTVDQTANAYRLAVDLKRGESREVSFVFEQPREELYRVADLGDAQIAAWAATQEFDPKLRQAMTELARLKRIAVDKKRAVDRIDADIRNIETDQQRLRANLQSADRDSALHKRYMQKLDDEETELEKLRTQRRAATDASTAADNDIDAYIAKLTI